MNDFLDASREKTPTNLCSRFSMQGIPLVKAADGFLGRRTRFDAFTINHLETPVSRRDRRGTATLAVLSRAQWVSQTRCEQILAILKAKRSEDLMQGHSIGNEPQKVIRTSMGGISAKIVGPIEEELITLFKRAPYSVPVEDRIRLIHLSKFSVPALLLASFYCDFFAELRKSEKTVSSTLITFVDELMSD